MKKRFLNSLWSKIFTAAAVFVSLTFWITGCDIGLGEAVDVSAPTLSISYPPSGAVIRDSFVLAGECSDDVLITSVTVRVVNTTSGGEVFKGAATVSDKSWQITLNNKDDSAYASTNGWQYADGTYEITAWASDNSGKTSGVSSRSVDIDNTAPFFIISKPGVTAASVSAGTGEAAAYGSTFTVTGTIADLHEISKMALDVYDGSGNLLTNSSSSDLAVNMYETSIATAGGTSVEFSNTTRAAGASGAVTSSDPMSYQRYVTLYGNVDNNSTETKNYTCTVHLTDAAKEYKNPSDSGTGEGNTTTQVYLYDTVYTSYLSSSKGLGLSASSLMNIYNGSQPNASLSMAALKSNAVDTSSFSGTDNRLAFTLNPAANPSYTFGGLQIYKEAGVFGDNQLASTSNVTATVSSGLNNTALKPSTIHVWVKDMTADASDGSAPAAYTADAAKQFVTELTTIAEAKHQLMEADGSTYTSANFKADVINHFDPNGKGNIIWCVKDNTSSTASSGTLITVPFGLSDEAGTFLKVNHYYIIAITGYDLDGLEFSQEKYYGFKATGTGKLPEIAVDSPSNLSIVKTSAKFTDTNGGLTFTGTAKNGDRDIDYITATVTVTDETTNTAVGTTETRTLKIGDGLTKVNSTGDWTWTFSPADCADYSTIKCESGKAYLYSVDFLVHDSGNSTSTVNRTVHVDSVNPVVTITSITPVLSDYGTGTDAGKSFVNGKITVKASVEETNLSDVKIEYFAGDASGTAVETVSAGKVYSVNNVFDTTKIVNNTSAAAAKNIIVKITATDKVGNVGTTTSAIYNHDTLGRPTDEEIIVDQLSDKPKIKPSNFEVITAENPIQSGRNLFGIDSNNTMKFSVEDDDGTVTNIAAYIDSDRTTNRYAGSYVQLGKYGSSLNAVSEGVHKVTIIARDPNYTSDDATPNNYVSETYDIAVSAGAPTITFTADSNSYKKGSTVTVNGTIKNASVSETTVTLTKPSGAKESITVPASGTATFTDTLTVSSTAEKETISTTYSLVDKYGQSSSEKFSYVVDNKTPTVTISSVTPTVEKTESGKTLYYVNGSITAKFNASDNYDLDKVEYACYQAESDATVTVTSGVVSGASSVDGLSGDYTSEKKFGADVSIDTTKITNTSGEKKKILILFKATDKAGNVSYASKQYYVDQETDRPVIKPSNFEEVSDYSDISAGKNLFGTTSNNKMKLSVEDDDDGTVSAVYAYIDSDNTTNRYSGGYVYLGTDTELELTGVTEGEHTVKIIARDSKWTSDSATKFNYVEKEYKIAVSAGAPVITLSTADASYKKGSSVTVGVTLTNPSLSKAVVKLTKPDGTTVSNIEVPAWTSSGGNGVYSFNDTISVTSAASKETITATYSLVDKYGQTSSEKVSYVVDNKVPTVTISSVTPKVENSANADLYFVNGKINVSFNASDNYDLKQVDCFVYQGDSDKDITIDTAKAETETGFITSTSGTRNTDTALTASYTDEKRFGTDWTVDTTKVSSDSTKKRILIVLKATDKAGSFTYATRQFVVDQETDRPTLSPSNFKSLTNGAKDVKNTADGNLFGITSNNKLMGSIEDDDGIKKIVCYYRRASAYNVSDDSATFSDAFASKVIFGSDDNTSNTPTSVNLTQTLPAYEGKYEVYFEAYDVNYSTDSATPYSKNYVTKTAPVYYYVGVSAGAPTVSLTALNNDGWTRSYSNQSATVAVSGKFANYTHTTTGFIKSVKRTNGSDTRDTADTTEASNLSRTESTTADGTFTDTVQPIYSLTTDTGKSVNITYTVTDIFDQTASATVTYTIDNSAPEFVLESNKTGYGLKIQNSTYAASTWYRGTDLSVEGWFYDAGKGISEINYSLTPAGETTALTGTIVATADSAAGTGYYKFKGTISGIKAGSGNSLVLSSTDYCGNKSNASTVTIKMDETAPEYVAKFISVDGGATNSDANGTVTVNGKQSIILYGTIKDSQSGTGTMNSSAAARALTYKIGGTEIVSDAANSKVCKTTFTTSTNDLTVWANAKAAAYADYSSDNATDITGWKTEISANNLTTGTLSAEWTDAAGNKSQNPSVLMFQVDDEAPSVTIRTSTTGVNGTSETIEGTVTENYSLAGMDLYYATTLPDENKAQEIYNDTSKDLTTYGWTRWTTATETDISKIYSWTYTGFNFNELSGADTAVENNENTGLGKIYILPVVKDKAGNSSAYKIGGTKASPTYSWNATAFSVDMNKDRPTVQVTNLTRSGSGTAADPYKYILKYGTDAQISGSVSDDDSTSSQAVMVLIGSSKAIKSVAIPSSGSTYTATFTDKTTADWTYSESGSTKKWTNADYGTTTLTGTDWTWTPANTEDGAKSVYFYVKDNNSSEFYTGNTTSGNLYKPYFQYKSETAENSSAALAYNSDCNSPEVRSVNVVSYSSNAAGATAVSTDAIGTTLIAGGSARRYIKFEITGYDANYIDGFTLEATGTDKTTGNAKTIKYKKGSFPQDANVSAFTENGAALANPADASSNPILTQSVWTTAFVDLSEFGTGEISVTVNAYDKSGLKGNGSYTFNIDNSAPVISNISPVATEEKTGTFTVSGSASDANTGRSGLASLTYLVPTKTQAAMTDAQLEVLTATVNGTTASVWQDKSALMENWAFNFNGGSGTTDCPKFESYTSTTASSTDYGSANENNIWTIPVYIKAEDALGNYTITRHSITYNPDGDKPKTEFTYPTDSQYQKDEDSVSLGYVTLGSTIRVTGTVTIPNADCPALADGVYVQIAQEVIKAKTALTLYKAKKALRIGSKDIATGGYLKASQITSLTLNDDYETESVAKDTVLTTAQAAVLTLDTDYYHAEDWAAAKTTCGTTYGYTVVTADTINTNDSEKVNIAAYSTNASGFTSEPNRTAWWGIPATSTSSSWVIAINQRNELNPTVNGTTNNIALRACSVNNAGKAGAWSNIYYVHIDNSAPVMSVKMRQYSGITTVTAENLKNATSYVEKDYEPGMYLKDDWYIYLEITDESGIVSDDTGVVLADSKTFYKDAFTKGGKNCYKVWIPVSGTEGNLLTYKVSATDTDTGNPHTVTSTYQVYIDNTAPVIGTVTTTTSGSASFAPATADTLSSYKIKDSNKNFTVSSSLTESGSGFERTVFYLIRKQTGAAYGTTSATSIFDSFSLDSTTKKPSDYKVAASGLTEVTVKQGTSTYSLYGKALTGSQTSSGVTYKNRFYAETKTDISENTHIRAGGLVYIGRLLRRIEKVDATNGYVEFDSDADGQQGTATFIYAQVVDNKITEGGTPSANGYDYTFTNTDDGDGMPEKVEITSSGATWTADFRSANLSDGPVTLVILAFDKAGNVSCKEIDTSIANNAPRIAKVYLGTDINGDAKYSANEFVEYDWSINEYNQKITTGYTDAMTLKTADYVSGVKSEGNGSAFKIKNGLAVVPEIVGGNLNDDGSIAMVYKKSATDTTAGTGTGTAVRAPSASTLYTLPAYDTAGLNGLTETTNKFYGYILSNQDISGKTDTELASATESTIDGTGKGMSFTFWDETEEGTKGSSTQSAVLYVSDFTVDLIDGTAPVAKIHPFHWNSKSENSIQKDASGELLGHIELEDDLVIKTTSNGTTTTTDTALKTAYGADPKVSGKIILTGYAYDETRLSKITIAGTASKFNPTNCYAEYKDNGSGTVTWTTASNTTEGWTLTVTDKREPDQQGHLAEWQLLIDTEKGAAIACENLTFTVTAQDATLKSTKNSSTPGTSATGRTTVYATDAEYYAGKFYSTVAEAAAGKADTGNSVLTAIEKCYEKGPADTTQTSVYAYYTGTTGKYQMDVVPYVEKVYTKLSKQKNSNWSVYNRSALGHYPVQSVVSNSSSKKTTTSEDVTLYGYNLIGTTVSIKDKSNTDLTVTKTAASDPEDGDHIMSNLKFNVAALASGELNATVDGIKVINNLNNNNAAGDATAAGTNNVNKYNMKGNGDTNNILTDDLVFDVWEFNDRAAVPINGLATGVQMQVNQYSHMLNFAFANGGLFYSMGDSTYSSRYWAGDWDTFAGPCVGFGVDSLGYTYSVDSGGDTNSSGHADKYVFYTSRWGRGLRSEHGTYNEDKDSSFNALRLEEIALKTGSGTFDYSLMKYRYLSSEMATSVSGSTTNLYLVNYDALTDEIRFRAGAISSTSYGFSGSKSTSNFGGFNDTYSNGTPSNYATTYCQVIANNSSASSTFAGNGATTTVAAISNRGAGQYVDIAVATNGTNSKDVACVVWYDAYDNCLKYTYATDPIGNWNTTHKGNRTAAGWSTPKTIFSEGGEYCQIAVDKNNHIHIAAYAGNGDVKYAYLAKYDSSYTESTNSCTVDASGAVGEHLTLDVALDASGNSIPYIGYFTSAIKAPKYAYLVDTTNTNHVPAGVDSNERFTGAWEVTVIPTMSRPTTNREDKINIGVFKTTAGVLNYSTTDGKVPATTGTSNIGTSYYRTGVNGYSSTEESKCYGNGSKNAVFAYQISGASGSCIETAQMR